MSALEQIGTVAEIWRYPLSACPGEQLETSDLTAHGLTGDREWAVSDSATGEVAAPERAKEWRPSLTVAVRSSAAGPQILVDRDGWVSCESAEALEALERIFGFPVEIKRLAAASSEADEGYAVPRYDRAPIHLITTAALDELRSLVSTPRAAEVRRFRPNVVIATEPGVGGFAEHGWVGQELGIGHAVLRVDQLCARCALPTLAQSDLPVDAGVLRGLARHAGGSFGVLCSVVVPKQIAVGMQVGLLGRSAMEDA